VAAVLAEGVASQQDSNGTMDDISSGHGGNGQLAPHKQPDLSPQHLSTAIEGVRQRTATDIGVADTWWRDQAGIELLPSTGFSCLTSRVSCHCRRPAHPQREVGGCGRAARHQARHTGHRWEPGHAAEERLEADFTFV
jgi:hypothetical protein